MKEDAEVNAVRVYRTKRKKPVKLTIVVGDGQPGGHALVWKGKISKMTKVVDKQVGKSNEELRGESLLCTTTVRDKNPSSNKTSVTYTLAGGRKGEDFPFSVDVHNDGGYATYLVRFIFI